MTGVRYTNICGRVEFLNADRKRARQLYRYAVDVVSAELLIELVIAGETIKEFENRV